MRASPSPDPKVTVLSWAGQLLAATILAQTLYFKFSGAEESVYIFTRLGAEPWGRIGSGIGELIAVVLLLIPHTAWIGALLGMAVMAGAIGAHVTKLGIAVQGDGGLLFALAVVTFLACAMVAYLRRTQIPRLRSRRSEALR